MTVCRFFQQGYCRFGNNCRFEHTNVYKYTNYQQQNNPQIPNPASATNVTPEQLYNQVMTDANGVLTGGQWVLSCYSPFKSKPNFPGMKDVSPEEIRLEIYEARGNAAMLLELDMQFQHRRSEMYGKFTTLSKPTKVIMDAIEKLYRNEIPDDPFQSSNMFGNSSSFFAPPPPNQSSSNIFAGGTANTGSNAASSLFASAAKDLFQTAASPFNTVNDFTSQMESSSAATASDPFRQPQMFQQQQQQNTAFPGFGSPESFTQTATTPASLFASANTALGGGGGGAPSAFETVPQNPFALVQSFPTQNNAAAPINPFLNNNNSNPSGNPFLRSEPESLEGIYSTLEQLTDEEIAAFESDSFKRGFIPEKPPPMELCYLGRCN